MNLRAASFALLCWISITACDAKVPAPEDASTSSPGPATVLDDAGSEHAVAPPRARVVSLVPGVTEVILALGAQGRLVGRTRYDDDPSLAQVPSVGGGLDPNVESVVALRPDLVVAWPDGDLRSIVATLSNAGVPVYQAEYRSLHDVERHIQNLGRLLGVEAAATEVLEELSSGFRTLATALEGADRPRVLYVVSLSPLMTTGPDTFLDSILRDAGASNLFADAPAPWPQVSFEEVVRRSPDYVVLPRLAGDGPALAELRDRAGWRSLPAVREGRVIEVDADLFGRPGPNLLAAARTLASRLHPGRVRPHR